MQVNDYKDAQWMHKKNVRILIKWEICKGIDDKEEKQKGLKNKIT